MVEISNTEAITFEKHYSKYLEVLITFYKKNLEHLITDNLVKLVCQK